MVKIYTTSTCPWCTKAKEYLKSLNIDFKELNVQSDMEARNEMIKKTKQGHVPVLEINNEIIIADFFFISYSFIIFNSEKAFIKLFSISSNSLSKILLFNIIIQLKPFW